MKEVHIWIGTFETNAMFIKYLEDSSLNQFSIDQKVDYYDEDWIEYFNSDKVGIADLIKKLSYSRSFKDDAIKSTVVFQSEKPNSVIMIDAEQIEKPKSASGRGYKLHYLGKYPGDVPISNRKNEIELKEQGLVSIPDHVFENPTLSYLDLYGNQITELPDKLFQMTELTYLNIADNQIKSLPQQLSKLKNLEILQLPGNQISEIQDGCFRFNNLQLLNLNENRLEILPDEIGNLTQLTNLMLRDNKLKSLPDTINNLVNLEQLSLAGNQFTEVPKNLKRPENIKYLSI